MLKKKRLGQFYTTNCKYILKDLNIPAYIQNIIEPFAGNGDLLNFVRKKNVECYDIDPRHSYIKKRDTLLNPPKYGDKFIFWHEIRVTIKRFLINMVRMIYINVF